MKLIELAKNKPFIITAEIFPPKGVDIDNVLYKADLLKDYIDAINITDNQRAVMRIGSLALSAYLTNKGYNVIYQLTCRDRNRLALQSDLLGASLLGIDNVLCLSGDHPKNGDHPDAKPVYDLDAALLVETVNKLNNGYDLVGNKLNKPTSFCIGAVCNPGGIPTELHTMAVTKKIQAGSKFFQTQIFFDNNIFINFIDKLNQENILFLPGVLLIKSKKMACNLNNVPGINIPAEIIKEFENTKNELEAGIEICANQIKELKKIARGIHLMAINAEENIPKILEKAL